MSRLSTIALSLLCIFSVAHMASLAVPWFVAREWVAEPKSWVFMALFVAMAGSGLLGILIAFYAVIRNPTAAGARILFLSLLAVGAAVFPIATTPIE